MKVLNDLESYVQHTLALHVDTTAWIDGGKLPAFLRKAYDFFVLRLMGHDYLLMLDLQKVETPPATVRKHMEQLHKAWPEEVIYVREQMTGYNRNRLIQRQVPFVVPGNQLYLPMLAVDLREHFIAKRTEVTKLTPAAQVLVLQSIYERRALFDKNLTLIEWAAELNYTKMTMSRAFRELRIIFEGEEPLEELRGRVLWDRLKPYFRNPVRRTRFYHVELNLPNPQKGPYLAGESALAHYTSMAEPNHTVVGMAVARWNRFVENHNPIELPAMEAGCVAVEVWRYPPARFAKEGYADPLSVYLTFEQNADERVEMALDELLEKVPW